MSNLAACWDGNVTGLQGNPLEVSDNLNRVSMNTLSKFKCKLSPIFGCMITPLLIASSYIPPAGSRQLQPLDLSIRFTWLNAPVLAARAQGSVFLAGDFNAGVSNLPDSDTLDSAA